MRKVLCLFLAFVCCFSLSGCASGDAEAKEAFEQIKLAYEIAEQIGSDIYTAWRVGLFESKELKRKGIEYMDMELELTSVELTEGLAATYAKYIDDKAWLELSEEEKYRYRAIKTASFDDMGDKLYGLCVLTVSTAYELNGEIARAEKALKCAEENMKSIEKRSTDKGWFSKLKEFYSNTAALLEYCIEPVGSYNQWSDSFKQYRDTAREQISALEYELCR